jgi:molecular chaperone GrpE (heat shock protein)
VDNLRLRVAVYRHKAAAYDEAVERVQSLRRALQTQQQNNDDVRRRLKESEAEIARLRAEYQQREAAHARQTDEGQRDAYLAFFQRLQPVLTQLPTLQHAVDEGGDLSARDVLDCLSPLHPALRELGFAPIGEAGGEVGYDPLRHRPVGRGAASVAADDPVRVRYVGYLYGDAVVCKAEVVPIRPED